MSAPRAPGSRLDRVRGLIRSRTILLVAFSLLAALPSRSDVQIFYQAVDIADVIPGQDRWSYHYEVFGFPAVQGSTFSVFFDERFFGALEVGSGAGEFDRIVIQPDVGLPANGYFDGLLTQPAPGLLPSFDVRFVWKGSGIPGPQTFFVNAPTFAPLAQGATQLLPEPDAVALIASGVLLLSALGARRR